MSAARGGGLRRAVAAVLLGGLWTATLSAAEEPAGGESPAAGPPASAFEQGLALEERASGLDEAGAQRTTELWDRASRAFERAAASDPEGPGYWRSARAAWLMGEQLAEDDDESTKQARVQAFERSKRLAEAGLAADPECAECMLWKVVSMARLGLERGLWASARYAPEMAELLDRAIALEPTHTDNANNSTLGNLHYSSAVLYRAMPDWWIVRLVLGVRGDKQRALRHIRQALELHPARLDYQVELGALLLCIGTSEDEPERLREGRSVLEDSLRARAVAPDAEREQMAARLMLAEPEKACGYAGDTWLEIDESDMDSVAKRQE